jgi:multicomponent Na+:H+ antiporter subunit C
VTALAYGVAGWLILVGCLGLIISRDLIHAVVSLSVAQAGSYVLLLAVGFQRGAQPPVFSSVPTAKTHAVDPVVQAMTLTDIVVSATVTALLLAIGVQIRKTSGTTDPDRLRDLQG